MRSYYFDNLPGDQRLLHDSGKEVSLEQLKAIGARYWHIPIDGASRWEDAINEIARERDYKNRDVINVTKEGLGDAYDAKLKMFYEEHMHEDEEIRYILSGSGFFDLREHPSDNWVRVHLFPGDLLVVPAGIYHRFTLDEGNKIRAMRLFKEEPKWTPHNRSEATDNNEYRIDYLNSLKTVAVA